MSSLSLQAQLAALNGSAGKHAGSVYAPTSRHADALGRGVHYNVQLGHTTMDLRRGYQASILESSARQAADVPLSMLKENFQQAIAELAEIYPGIRNFLSLAETSTKKQIHKLLVAVGSLTNELNALESCLHVLEFMIRRYSIHTMYMEDFLWILLPLADVVPAVVHRGLQLVDLQTNQSYLWLRPYANPKLESNTIIPRKLMAQNILQRPDLVRKCGQWAQHVMMTTTTTTIDGDTNESGCRRGVSHILSFTAALLVEGLAWQSKAGGNLSSAQLEATTRALLHLVLDACRNTKHAEWRGWGHVIASVLAETMDLAYGTTQALSIAILRGSGTSSADALVALLSVLLPPQQQVCDQDRNYLLLLNDKLLGCDLPPKATSMLLLSNDGNNNLPSLLGHLAEEGRITVAPLLATLLVQVASSSSSELTTAMVSLIKEPSLQTTWTNTRMDLVASSSAFLVNLVVAGREEEEDNEEIRDHTEICRTLIQAFHAMDADACERGIAMTIRSLSTKHDDSATLKEARNRWTKLLDGVVEIGADTPGGDDDVDMEDEDASEEERRGRMLPPRVALEHAHASVRLGAVERLVKEMKKSTADGDEQRASIAESFFRRWSVDDNETVACAAAMHVLEALKSETLLVVGDESSFAELCLSGLRNWQDLDSLKCIEHGLAITGHVAQAINNNIGQQTSSQHLWESLVGAIASWLGNANLESAAAKAVFIAFGKKPGKKADLVNSAFKLVLSTRSLFERLVDTESINTPSLNADLRQKLLWSLLSYFKGRSAQVKKSSSLSEDALLVCFALLRLRRVDPVNEVQSDLLKTSFETAVEGASKDTTVADLLQALAGVEDEGLFQSVSVPVISFLLDLDRSNSPCALLLEAAACALEERVQSRLVLYAATHITGDESRNRKPWLSLISSLAFLESTDSEVRQASLKIISGIKRSTVNSHDWSNLEAICNIVSASEMTASMENKNLLATLLSHVATEVENPVLVQELLLKLTVFCVIGDSEETPALSAGGCYSAATVLKAMETAGEASFPLLVRWETAGIPLYKNLTAIIGGDPVLPAFVSLFEAVLVMLKGVTVQKQSSVMISSGPRNNGGRSRSYSVGRNEGLFLKSYPKSMSVVLVEILERTGDKPIDYTIGKITSELVLSSKSWGEEIFTSLSKTVRTNMARAVLAHSSSEHSGLTHSQFELLPFEASDLATLVSEVNRDSVATVSLLADFVRVKADKLRVSSAVTRLIAELFSLLEGYNSTTSLDDGSLDSALWSTTKALIALWDTDGGLNIKQGTSIKKWADIVTHCFETYTKESRVSYRTRTVIIELLLSMTRSSPRDTLTSLRALILYGTSLAYSDLSEACRCLSLTVPTFFEEVVHSKTSIADLFQDLVRSTKDLEGTRRTEIFRTVAKALAARGSLSKDEHQSAPGSLVASLLASEVDSITVGDLLEYIPAGALAMSLLFLLDYTKSCLLTSFNKELPKNSSDALPSFEQSFDHYLGLSSKSIIPAEKLSDLACRLVKTVSDTLLLENMHNFVKRSQGAEAALCLRMWQDLLVIHSMAQGADVDDDWSSFASLVNESTGYLQSLLPAHIFLAAVSSLIKEGDTHEIRARALRLLVDRIPDIDPTSDDLVSFMDLIPDVVDILKNSDENEPNSMVLRQAALVTIEQLTRVSSLSDKVDIKAHLFLSALERSTNLLKRPCQALAADATTFARIGTPSLQMISSVALCASTLIRATGPRCISTLPKFVKRLVVALSSANSHLATSVSEEDTSIISQARLVQTSCLRALTAIAETIPQFLSTYLHTLFTESALLSPSLRLNADAPLLAAVQRFDGALAAGVPTRLLLPSLKKAAKPVSDPTSLHVLLSLVRSAVTQCSGVEAVAQRNVVLEMSILAFEFNQGSDSWRTLVETGSAVFLALIMKLSEVQLRRIFTSFRDWRGDFDTDSPAENAAKRFAFWSVCTLLAKELGPLFLPCLSTTLTDVVSELELASQHLTQSASVVSNNKKRKLEQSSEQSFDELTMQSLQPLLMCLEYSLRADASDGGQWVRADVNIRYHAILEPLGNLLLARLPSNFPLPDGIDNGYGYVIQGSHVDVGNVVACLSALANAAGNEQLWKPLNHYVLEACGYEGRSQVRRAGLLCMLSLVKSLGEEYMVLLPECLPTLSELLEDTDDEIAGLARECINMAEDLIGESLEDSLR